MHRNEVLHLLSLMRSPKAEFSQDDAWILGKMALLLLKRKPNEVQDFAARSMEIFQQHQRFAAIGRICLVKRIGLSNSIIVKSCEHVLSNENTMQKDYSCFVDSQGSLFQLKSSEIRIYEDANKVVQSFAILKKPAQRSIHRIASMGLKSGICLPLFHKTRVIGYVFINETESRLSELRDSDYCILSYFGTAATVALMDSGLVSEAYHALAEQQLASYLGDIFSEADFDRILHAHLQSLDCAGPKTEITLSGPETLLSMGNIANLLSRIIYFIKATAIIIDVSSHDGKVHWRVEFKGPKALNQDYLPAHEVWEDFRSLDIPYKIHNEQLLFSHNFEAVDRKSGIKYSI